MNIAIVDDIPAETEPLKSYLSEYAAQNRLDFIYEEYLSAEGLLSDYRPLRYTVIFMDIFMEGMTGVEASKKIRESDSDTYLVFLTNSLEFMPEAFSLHAFEYMEKPVNRERVYALMDDILKLETDRNVSPTLEVTVNRAEIRIPYEDIVYIRSEGNYQEITDKDGNNFKTRMRFSDVSALLKDDPRFLTLLRGMLVNMDYIIKFDKDVCHIKENIRLPVNIKNAVTLEKIWKNYVFQKIRRGHRGKEA